MRKGTSWQAAALIQRAALTDAEHHQVAHANAGRLLKLTAA